MPKTIVWIQNQDFDHILVKKHCQVMKEIKQPSRISQLELQGRAGEISARQADLDLLEMAPEGFLDTTHFDTVRFPPPNWVAEAFAQAASDG